MPEPTPWQGAKRWMSQLKPRADSISVETSLVPYTTIFSTPACSTVDGTIVTQTATASAILPSDASIETLTSVVVVPGTTIPGVTTINPSTQVLTSTAVVVAGGGGQKGGKGGDPQQGGLADGGRGGGENKTSSNAGAIAGGTVGGVAGAAILLLLLLLVWRKRSRNRIVDADAAALANLDDKDNPRGPFSRAIGALGFRRPHARLDRLFAPAGVTGSSGHGHEPYLDEDEEEAPGSGGRDMSDTAAVSVGARQRADVEANASEPHWSALYGPTSDPYSSEGTHQIASSGAHYPQDPTFAAAGTAVGAEYPNWTGDVGAEHMYGQGHPYAAGQYYEPAAEVVPPHTPFLDAQADPTREPSSGPFADPVFPAYPAQGHSREPRSLDRLLDRDDGLSSLAQGVQLSSEPDPSRRAATPASLSAGSFVSSVPGGQGRVVQLSAPPSSFHPPSSGEPARCASLQASISDLGHHTSPRESILPTRSTGSHAHSSSDPFDNVAVSPVPHQTQTQTERAALLGTTHTPSPEASYDHYPTRYSHFDQ